MYDFKTNAEFYARHHGLTDPCIVSGELNGEKVYFTNRVGAVRWQKKIDIQRDGGVFPNTGIAENALKASDEIYGDTHILNRAIEKLDSSPLTQHTYPDYMLNH